MKAFLKNTWKHRAHVQISKTTKLSGGQIACPGSFFVVMNKKVKTMLVGVEILHILPWKLDI